MTDEEFGKFLNESVEDLDTKQTLLQSKFGVGHHERFVVDYEVSRLTFFANEAPMAEAAILPLFTHSRTQRTICWSWANTSLPFVVRESALRVKTLGDLTGFELFFDEQGKCDESMAWEIAAMACKHFSAAGAYRVPHANVDFYVLLTSVISIGGQSAR